MRKKPKVHGSGGTGSGGSVVVTVTVATATERTGKNFAAFCCAGFFAAGGDRGEGRACHETAWSCGDRATRGLRSGDRKKGMLMRERVRVTQEKTSEAIK